MCIFEKKTAMKKMFAFLLMTTMTMAIFAQEDDIEVSSRFGKNDRLMIDLYSDMWQNAPDSADIKGFNRGASVSMMQDFKFGATNFSFAIGLGLGTHNMFYNANLVKDSLGVTQFNQRVDEPKMNKLVLSYIDVPVELRFRTKRDNVFRFAVGGKFGYEINNHIKFVDEGIKVKSFNITDINPIRYGVTLRVGYKMFNAYVYYGLSTLFKDKMGPEMTPISFGISIIPF